MRLLRRRDDHPSPDEIVALLTAPRVLDDDGWPESILDARGVRLRGVSLAGLDLRRVDLARADLSGADLAGADLRKASLAHAHLARAVLARADLSGADVSWADFSHADLTGVKVDRTRMAEATFHHADLSDVDLRTTTGITDGCFKGAHISSSTRWPSGFEPDAFKVGGPVIHRMDVRRR